MNELEMKEDEIFNQMITGAIVLKTTFLQYIELVDLCKAKADILYQKKTFNPAKKLIITEVEN